MASKGFFFFFYCFTYSSYNAILTLHLITILSTLNTLFTLRYITVLNITLEKKYLQNSFLFCLNSIFVFFFKQSLTPLILLYLHHIFSFFWHPHTYIHVPVKYTQLPFKALHWSNSFLIQLQIFIQRDWSMLFYKFADVVLPTP